MELITENTLAAIFFLIVYAPVFYLGGFVLASSLSEDG